MMLLILTLMSTPLFADENFSAWGQNDYQQYIQTLDKKIASTHGSTKKKYVKIREMIINIYRLGREYENHNCPDGANKKHADKKESA